MKLLVQSARVLTGLSTLVLGVSLLSQIFGLEVIGWYLSILTGAILFTWLFNSTGGSVLVERCQISGSRDLRSILFIGRTLLSMVGCASKVGRFAESIKTREPVLRVRRPALKPL